MRPLLSLLTFLSLAAAAASTHGADDSQGKALTRLLEETVLRRVRQAHRAHTRQLQAFSDSDICSFIDKFTSDQESEGIACACSSDDVSYTIGCTTTESFDPSLLYSSDYGSIESFEVTVKVILDTWKMISSTCATFGSDYFVERLRGDRFCIDVTMSPKPGFDHNTIETGNDFDIDNHYNTTCQADLNGNPCVCEICGELLGIKLSCDGDGNEFIIDCAKGFIEDPAAQEEGGQGEGMGDSFMTGFEGSIYVPKFIEREGKAVDDSPDQSGNETDSSSAANGAGEDQGDVALAGNCSDSNDGSFTIDHYNVQLALLIFVVALVSTLVWLHIG